MIELYLYGDVHATRAQWLEEEGKSYICPEIVRDLLTEAQGEDITVYMNTFGGDAYAGIAIRHMFQRYKGTITAVIDGTGASAGSMILTGADKVQMYPDSTFMLHFPWVVAAGNSNDFEQLAEDLKQMNKSVRASYEERFTGTTEELDELLSKDTWLTAQEALQYGFCDEILTATKNVKFQANALRKQEKEAPKVHAENGVMANAKANENTLKKQEPEHVKTEEIPAEKPQEETEENAVEAEEQIEDRQDNPEAKAPVSFMAKFKKERESVLQKFKKDEDETV